MPFGQQKYAEKGPQEYLISRSTPIPISWILRMDDPLIRKTFAGVFTGKLRLAAPWKNINSHWVCKNQEIVRFLENARDGI